MNGMRVVGIMLSCVAIGLAILSGSPVTIAILVPINLGLIYLNATNLFE